LICSNIAFPYVCVVWWIVLYFSRFILSRKIFIKINRTLIFLNIHQKVRLFFTLF